jgi:hypothetical protein
MTEEELNDPWGRKRHARELQERRARREAFLADLFETDDYKSQIAPPKPVDHDALLEEHLAQLHNAVRDAMQYAIADDCDVQSKMVAVGGMTRMIRTSLAIALALRDGKKSKTVHGGAEAREPQD